MINRLQEYVAENPLEEGEWLLGRGWDQNLWGGDFPTKEDLDPYFPDIPVYLRRVDGHACWVNSETLRISLFPFPFHPFPLRSSLLSLTLAHLPQVPPLPEEDPEGGIIIRDEKGEPTGVFIGIAPSG